MPKDKLTDFDVIEIIEQEMISMWATGEIPHLHKNYPEFVKVITEGIYMEKSFWKRHMVIGEA